MKPEDARELIEKIREKDGKTEEKTLSKEHKEDCDSLKMVKEGKWETPWTFVDNQTEFVSNDIAVILRCNDRECPGKIAVDADELLQFIKPVVDDDRFTEEMV